MNETTIVVGRSTQPSELKQDYQQLLAELAWEHALDRRAATLIVVRMDRRFFLPGACTPPWQLEAVLQALAAAGFEQLCLAIVTPDRAALRIDAANYRPLCQAYRVLPAVAEPASLVGANLILLAPLAADVRYGLAGTSLLLADLIKPTDDSLQAAAQLQQILPNIRGCMALLDATTIADGPGPYAIYAQPRGTLLGSLDPRAVDMFASHLIGVDSALLRWIKAPDWEQLHFTGDSAVMQQRWNLNPSPDGFASLLNYTAFLPAPLRKPFRWLLQQYRWPMIERQLMMSWLHHTEWGQCMQTYLTRT